MRRGLDVTFYEALDRIGGRIHTATGFASYPVELGAIFFAGEATNTDHASMGYVHGAEERAANRQSWTNRTSECAEIS